MNARLTVWCLGTKVPPAAASAETEIRFAAEPSARMATISVARLNERLAATETDLVGLVDAGGPMSRADFPRAAKILDEQQDAAGVILSAESPVVGRNLWDTFPLRVASLMQPLGPETALVVRRGELTGLNEVSAPLWDWLIRAIHAGRLFAVMPVEMDAGLQASDFLPELSPRAPGRDRAWLAEHLQRVRPEELVAAIRSRPDAQAVKAGLLQLHDFLDESHSISQSIEGEGRHRAADYWHAIMHRREPDDSNAKYWFRRVGRHPILSELADRAATILSACPSPDAASWQDRLLAGGWDAFAFVDLCAHCRRAGDEELTRAARQIQLAEMWLLLEQTIADAGEL